jgi:hypothetical protein
MTAIDQAVVSSTSTKEPREDEPATNSNSSDCVDSQVYASIQHTKISRSANAADDDAVLSLAVRTAG